LRVSTFLFSVICDRTDKTLPQVRHFRLNLTLRFGLAQHAAAHEHNTKKGPQGILHMHQLLILSSVGDSTTPVAAVGKAQ
jgi:hypothetical protein